MPGKFLVCYICGRQFTFASLGIHEPQCLIKWNQEQALLPPSQRLSSPPARPNGWDQLFDPKTTESEKKQFAENWNENADAQFMEARAECPNCGRKFHPPERLEIHMRSCRDKDSFFAQERKSKNATENSNPAVRKVSKLDKIARKESSHEARPVAGFTKANYCEQCGSQFITVIANFCSNCGEKRPKC